LLGGLDGLFAAGGGLGGAVGEGQVTALTPLLDYFGLFFVFGAGVVGGWVGACDGATWCYTLLFVSFDCKSACLCRLRSGARVPLSGWRAAHPPLVVC